jgi:hypothetical protein
MVGKKNLNKIIRKLKKIYFLLKMFIFNGSFKKIIKKRVLEITFNFSTIFLTKIGKVTTLLYCKILKLKKEIIIK